MKLIVESGATKSNWVLLKGDNVLSTQKLEGINMTSNPSSVHVVDSYDSTAIDSLKSIHFYGAGLSSPNSQDKLKSKLSSTFSTNDIQIDTDILGAALSVSQSTPSIVSILGTGINTIVYDGQKIIDSVKSMGYLISEPGSGFGIGQEIIKAYYYAEMNENDRKQFEEEYIPKNQDLIPYLYSLEKPNFEIAKFSKFLQVCDSEFRSKILAKSFSHFFGQQILPLESYKKYKLTFVGSIAAVFENELHSAAEKNGREILKIVGDPLDGLIEYHKSN